MSKDLIESRAADVAEAKEFAIEASRMLADTHCEDVTMLDVGGVSQLCKYVVIGTGTSDRQMKSVGDDVEMIAKKDYGLERFGQERDPSVTWLVLDFGDVMVHLFEPATRAHYDLEMLWGDVPTVEWKRK